jgi:hypothetical protein
MPQSPSEDAWHNANPKGRQGLVRFSSRLTRPCEIFITFTRIASLLQCSNPLLTQDLEILQSRGCSHKPSHNSNLHPWSPAALDAPLAETHGIVLLPLVGHPATRRPTPAAVAQ